jgi:hypothetical protein
VLSEWPRRVQVHREQARSYMIVRGDRMDSDRHS